MPKPPSTISSICVLDHVSSTPVLEIKDWPRSITRKEWFAISCRLTQQAITDMDLALTAEAELIEAFMSAGLL